MSEISEYAALARKTPTTGRREASYIGVFGIEDYNERILDIGSGRTVFSRLPNLVQFDYAYTDPARRPSTPRNAVCGLAQCLPFADESFDRVTFRNGHHEFTPNAAAAALFESLYVLRPGGKCQVFPVFYDKGCGKLARDLQAEGFPVSITAEKRTRRLAIGLGTLAAFESAGVVANGAHDKLLAQVLGGLGSAATSLVAYASAHVSHRARLLTIERTAQMNPTDIAHLATTLAPMLPLPRKQQV